MNNCNITIYQNGEDGPHQQLTDITGAKLCELLGKCVSHKTRDDGVVICYPCASVVPIMSFHGPNTSKAEGDVLITYGTYSRLLLVAKALY